MAKSSTLPCLHVFSTFIPNAELKWCKYWHVYSEESSKHIKRFVPGVQNTDRQKQSLDFKKENFKMNRQADQQEEKEN